MLKKNDPHRKNRRKNKSKNKPTPKQKPKINKKDMYDISQYIPEEVAANLASYTKQKFADGVQRILDRAEEKNK